MAGKVEAQIDAEIYDKRPQMRDELHQVVKSRFRGAQLLSHKPYKLSNASVFRLHPDGRRDATVLLEGIKLSAKVGLCLDVVVTDKDGNVVTDSRKDRLERQKQLAELIESCRAKDPLVDSILSSFDKAVGDRDNELVHLYEIRDALETRFAGRANAQASLGVNETEWRKFGRLANVEPIRQGRHRGLSAGAPRRDATEVELEEARGFARRLIEGYLRYLAHTASP